MVVKKPVIILLPPMGHSHDFFTLLEKELNSTYSVISLNYPLTNPDNNQDKNNSILNYYVDNFCKEILNLNERVYLCGLSLGATLSLRIKERLGDKIISIILMASGGLKVARARKEMVLHHIEHITSHKAFIGKALSLDSLDNFLLHFDKGDAQERAREYFYNYLNTRWEDQFDNKLGLDFIKAAAEAIEINYEDLLHKYQSEILLLWGMKDRVFSQRHLKRFEKVMPKATFHKFENLGHYLPLESPKDCAKILIDLCKL